jgi:ribosome-associated protein
MLKISDKICIPDSELEFSAIRASGPGGQNVNKVSSAVHLRFNAKASTALPDDVRERLLNFRDKRITPDGIIVIKAQRSRSQDKNRADALNRLEELIRPAMTMPKKRRKTKPGKKAKEKRLADKSHRAKIKQTRGKVSE